MTDIIGHASLYSVGNRLEVKTSLEKGVVVVGEWVIDIAQLHGKCDTIHLELVAEFEAQVSHVEALSGIIPIELITYARRTPEGACPR